MAVSKKEVMILPEGKKHRITGPGLSVETTADIGTIFRSSTSDEQKEVAWGRIKQKFLYGEPNTMEEAEGADAVKELILFGDRDTMSRAVNLLAEGLREGSYHTDFAVNVSWMVLVSADTNVLSQPHPFKAVLNMIEDTLMHGSGSITSRDANMHARERAGSALGVALGYCGDRTSGHDRANVIAQALALAVEHGDSGTRSIAVEILNGERGKTESVGRIMEEWREHAKTALIRSVNGIKPRTETPQDS
ncbi:hypothetical protein M1589_04875 [Candidatus Marsarchaeota archaeon]|jgi:hypothetical protein|nr:hypothetical protein [Candidatus Marsarchaeota archaeon]MCL5115444.1 hypothetical protein [Candidatus Marsarchaeota archaeon]